MEFEFLTLTPPSLLDPSLAIAASRAGAVGVLDLEYVTDFEVADRAITTLRRLSRSRCGIRLAADSPDLSRAVLDRLSDPISIVVVTAAAARALSGDLEALRARATQLLMEVTDGEVVALAEQLGADGLIAKGLEAGGWVGDETTFVLLQRLLENTRLPVWAQGGIGLHTVAACLAGGAAGAVLDAQLTLTRESSLPPPVKAAVARSDGSETVCLGEELGARFRMFARPGLAVLDELRRIAAALRGDERPLAERVTEWRSAVRARVGWGDRQVWPLGQDAAFASGLAGEFVTVGGVIGGLRDAAEAHIVAARRTRPLAEGSALARSHGTRYPIVQGPMTRVSDTAAFAEAVAGGGALPFLALALLRGPEVRALMEETSRQLGDRPWGVGILGFVPVEVREEQLQVIQEIRPPFALIAGGRPDQSASLEREGISTYLHVPSPALLRMFLESGARRFVFEGRECGGHVGPRSSFVLWNTMIDVLLEAVRPGETAEACHVIFAGGIHDARSASMVAAMAAPLVDRGIKIGVLLGTAYLFTEEAVERGAIVRGFQEEALRCSRTVLLETGPGHATRCAATAFADSFDRERRRLLAQGLGPEAMRDALEALNLGRLRIASKGVTRNPRAGEAGQPRLVTLPEDEQHLKGMFMIGQVATLRHRVCSIAELHGDVAHGGTERLGEGRPAGAEATESAPRPCDIAIIGMSCILPKAPTLDAFWANILNKVDAITEIPPDRFDWRTYYDPDPQAADKIYAKTGGFIDPVPFDPTRYGIPPNTLPSIEPLQLLTLEAARTALEDAGYAARNFSRARTGIIVGTGGGVSELGQRYTIRSGLPTYLAEVPGDVWDRLPEWTEDSFAGIILNVAAGRVANRFDLGGVNYTVDAACASSLAALYAAVRELETGTADMMIVAGADTGQNPLAYLCFSKTRALSPGGRCHPFDEGADGTAIGEGIAVVVLKRLADAERDGDRIYAVIKAAAGSSDGRDRSMTAPRPEGQMLALERAYAAAGISPARVGLIEAHGTGTVAGDESEISALTRVFGKTEGGRQWCAVGSVKSMIGHTKCAAGLAGLIKVTKALHHKVLPPTIGVERPNVKARFAEGPFYVNTETRPWLQCDDGPRRAGVSAFGFGGTNFHVVVEEYTGTLPSAEVEGARDEWPAELFVLSAAACADLLASVDALAGSLDAAPGTPLRRLAALAWERARAMWAERGQERLTLALVATSLDDLRTKLGVARGRLSEGAEVIEDPRGIYFSGSPLAGQGSVAFLFPGQGSQYPDMLRELTVCFSEVSECFEAASRRLAGRFTQPLGRYIFPPPRFSPEEERAAEEALKQTNVAQPALGAADLGMFRLLSGLGVRADIVAGHSYGEYVALCTAGALGEDRLYDLSEVRGRFMLEGAGPEPGVMAAVQAGRAAVTAALDGTPDVWIANLNGPEQTVLSGTRAGIAAVTARLEAVGLAVRPVPVSCAFHSPLVAEAGHRFADYLATVDFAAPRIKVFSNAEAAPYDADASAILPNLTRHLVRPVRFLDQIEAMYTAGCRIFVEVGPRNVLTALVQRILAGQRFLAVPTDVPGRSGPVQLLHALGQLAANGVALSLDRLFAGRLADRVSEPRITPTTWLVSGGHVRPVKEAPIGSKRPRSYPGPSGPALASAPAPLAVRPEPAPPREAVAAPQASPRPGRDATPALSTPAESTFPWAAGGATSEGVGEADGVMAHFQRTMARFLDTQRAVMLAYLGAAAGPSAASGAELAEATPLPAEATVARPVELVGLRSETDAVREQSVAASVLTEDRSPSASLASPPAYDADWVRRELVRVASERTGYPVEMLDLDANMEADLGIDSIKRMEILGALRQGLPAEAGERVQGALETLARAKTLRSIVETVAQLASEATLAAGEARPAAGGLSLGAAPAVDADWVRRELVRVASERTGYPVEMLDLDANMEADLGIDSIKRMEILGALRQGLPAEAGERVQGALETLTRAKTLRSIVETVAGLLDEAPARTVAAGETPRGEQPAASVPAPAPAGLAVPRFLLTTVDRPVNTERSLPLPKAPIVLVEDDGGVAALVGAELSRRGALVLAIEPGDEFAELDAARYRVALSDGEQVTHLVRRVRERHGGVGGLLCLSSIGRSVPIDQLDVEAWRERLGRGVKGLARLLRGFGQDLRDTPGGFVLAVTAMDGAFGCRSIATDAFAGDAGVVGLIKALAMEWPGTRCKAVDTAPEDSPDIVAANLITELGADDAEVEVGWAGQRRVGLRLRLAAHDARAARAALDSEAVVLVTGGARGITAEVVEELARRYQPILVLVGRTPLPREPEAAATAGIDSPQALRAALIAELSRAGRRATPAEVERAAKDILRDREVRRRIATMTAAGATVAYRDIDVCDASALAGLVEELYRTYGRIDAVVHGAGVIEDKLFLEKGPESFDRVFDTKVEGAFALARALRPDSLRFLVFFSSVAGRFGNRGQSDYVAANEVMNKLARQLDRRWPGRVVALGWGPWSGSGMVSGEVARQFAERGVLLVPPEGGRRRFLEELECGSKGDAEVVLGDGPWERVEDRAHSARHDWPLLNGAPVVVADGGVEVVRALDAAEDVYLNDHRLDNNAVLPAMMAMELVAESVQKGWPDWKLVGFRDFRVLRGVVLNGHSTSVRIAARSRTRRPGLDSALEVEVELFEAERSQPSYRVTAELAQGHPEAFSVALPDQSLLRPFPLSAERAYADWLFHGPCFQCITAIEGMNDHEIVARLQPSAPTECVPRAGGAQWLTDPVVLDGGLQLGSLWARATWDLSAMPSRFREFRLCAPLSSAPALRAHLKIRPESGRHAVCLDVFFTTLDGRVLATFEQLELTCSQPLNRLMGWPRVIKKLGA